MLLSQEQQIGAKDGLARELREELAQARGEAAKALKAKEELEQAQEAKEEQESYCEYADDVGGAADLRRQVQDQGADLQLANEQLRQARAEVQRLSDDAKIAGALRKEVALGAVAQATAEAALDRLREELAQARGEATDAQQQPQERSAEDKQPQQLGDIRLEEALRRCSIAELVNSALHEEVVQARDQTEGAQKALETERSEAAALRLQLRNLDSRLSPNDSVFGAESLGSARTPLQGCDDRLLEASKRPNAVPALRLRTGRSPLRDLTSGWQRAPSPEDDLMTSPSPREDHHALASSPCRGSLDEWSSAPQRRSPSLGAATGEASEFGSKFREAPMLPLVARLGAENLSELDDVLLDQDLVSSSRSSLTGVSATPSRGSAATVTPGLSTPCTHRTTARGSSHRESPPGRGRLRSGGSAVTSPPASPEAATENLSYASPNQRAPASPLGNSRSLAADSRKSRGASLGPASPAGSVSSASLAGSRRSVPGWQRISDRTGSPVGSANSASPTLRRLQTGSPVKSPSNSRSPCKGLRA